MITCHQLSRTFRNKPAIDRVTMSIDSNKMVGIIGGSGAGKTTLLKMIAGYLQPTSGSVSLNGKNVFDNLDVLSTIKYAGDDEMIIPSMKIAEIIRHYAAFYPRWNGEAVYDWLQRSNLKDNIKYKELSKGMQRQLQIRAALGSRMPVLLLDEPLSGLDYYSSKEMCSLLLEEYMIEPRTMVISTHNMKEIEHILEEIIFMYKGRLILHKPLSVLQHYAIRLTGPKELLLSYIEEKSIYECEGFGNNCTIAIRNYLASRERQQLEQMGISIGKVDIQDLYIYVTRLAGQEEGSNDADF